MIPIRGPTIARTCSQPGGGASIAIGPAARSVVLCSSVDAQRLAELARAGAQVLEPVEPAPRAHVPDPSSGSSARISTAAPTPSASQTALSRAWMPYERYTYARPGGPNRAPTAP